MTNITSCEANEKLFRFQLFYVILILHDIMFTFLNISSADFCK